MLATALTGLILSLASMDGLNSPPIPIAPSPPQPPSSALIDSVEALTPMPRREADCLWLGIPPAVRTDWLKAKSYNELRQQLLSPSMATAIAKRCQITTGPTALRAGWVISAISVRAWGEHQLAISHDLGPDVVQAVEMKISPSLKRELQLNTLGRETPLPLRAEFRRVAIEVGLSHPQDFDLLLNTIKADLWLRSHVK